MKGKRMKRVEIDKIKINKRKNEVILNLDTRFYDFNSIRISLAAFGESCNTSVDEDKNGVVRVILSPRSEDMDIDTLGYEFCNYVLGAMQNIKAFF